MVHAYMSRKHDKTLRDVHSSGVEFAWSKKHFKWIFIKNNWNMGQEKSRNCKDIILHN